MFAPGVEVLALRTDCIALVHALDELIHNALSAGATAVTVTADAVGAESEPGWLLISVADDAPDIPEHVRERLYEADASKSKKGSGLGLYIIHETLRELGGRIELEQAGGKGKRFIMRVPTIYTPKEVQGVG